MLVLFFCACGSESNRVSYAPPAPDAGCPRTELPRSYQIAFVVDVSGSMSPFLRIVRDQMVAFADAIAAADAQGQPIRADYYVIGFVDDHQMYGDGRMSSSIALQAAFDAAIAAGLSNFNLTRHVANADIPENALDALGFVPSLVEDADARLVLVATDAPFPEAPAVLSENFEVESRYSSVWADYERLAIRVHAFVPAQGIDGLTRDFKGQPALTTLPGSSVHPLQDLADQPAAVRDALTSIARDSACR